MKLKHFWKAPSLMQQAQIEFDQASLGHLQAQAHLDEAQAVVQMYELRVARLRAVLVEGHKPVQEAPCN